MSPTKRDLSKRTVAAVAASSMPAVAGATQTTSLLSVPDALDDVSLVLAGVKVTITNHWAELWSREQRAHFLEVIDREFPELAADVIDQMQWSAANPAEAADQ